MLKLLCWNTVYPQVLYAVTEARIPETAALSLLEHPILGEHWTGFRAIARDRAKVYTEMPEDKGVGTLCDNPKVCVLSVYRGCLLLRF